MRTVARSTGGDPPSLDRQTSCATIVSAVCGLGARWLTKSQLTRDVSWDIPEPSWSTQPFSKSHRAAVARVTHHARPRTETGPRTRESSTGLRRPGAE